MTTWEDVVKSQRDLASLVDSVTKPAQQMMDTVKTSTASLERLSEPPPQELRDIWERHAQREVALLRLPALVEDLTELLENELRARKKNEQADKLLQRAADLISAAWDSPNTPIEGIPWIRAAGRWISDYERRDEWVNTNDDQQG